MYERVYFKLLLALCLVEYPVAGKKHEVSELIPLRLVAFQSEIEDQTAHSTARMKNAHPLPSLKVDRIREVAVDFLFDRVIAHLSLFSPLANYC